MSFDCLYTFVTFDTQLFCIWIYKMMPSNIKTHIVSAFWIMLVKHKDMCDLYSFENRLTQHSWPHRADSKRSNVVLIVFKGNRFFSHGQDKEYLWIYVTLAPPCGYSQPSHFPERTLQLQCADDIVHLFIPLIYIFYRQFAKLISPFEL